MNWIKGCSRTRRRAAASGIVAFSLAGSFLGSCSIDDRDFSGADGTLSSNPLQPSSGAGAAGDGAEPNLSLGGATQSVGPRLSVDVTALDFGPVVLSSPSFGAIRARNTGDSTLPVPLIQLGSGSDPAFSILQNRCASPLEPNTDCQIRLQFLPNAPGQHARALTVASGTDSFSVDLTGTGLAGGDLGLSPDAASSPDFGGVVVGDRREATFSVINPSQAASGILTLSLVNVEFELQPPTGPECVSGTTNLAAGASCNIRVAFAPSERNDLVAGTLTVASAAVGAASLSLTGVALAPAELSVASSVDFGSVVLGQSSRAAVTLANEGDQPLDVPVPTLDGTDAASFTILENRCGTQLNPKSKCDVSVQFQPQRPDAHDAELVLTPAAGSPTLVALHGVGLQPGALVAATGDAEVTTEFDFGSLVVDSVTPPTQTFRITNTGGTSSGALAISVNNITGGLFSRASTFVEGDCVTAQTSLEPAESCNVRVSFVPSGAGAAEGQLTVSSDLAGSSSVRCIGTGLGPAKLALGSADLVQFGTVVTQTVVGTDVIVRNDGDATLDAPTAQIVPGASGQLAEFALAAGCTAALETGATCTLHVDFKPTLPGAQSASLQVSAGDGGQTSVGLIGRSVVPGSLAVSPATATFGAQVGAQSAAQTFTVSNLGTPSGPLRFNTNNPDFIVQAARAGSADCVFGQTQLGDGQPSTSCTLQVLYAPKTRTLGATASLSISSAVGTASVGLTGSAQAPAALSGSQTTSFGTVVVGQSGRYTWTVTNTGDQATSALQLSNSNTTDYRFENDTCTVSLASQSSCSVVIVFEPKSQNVPNSPLAASFTLSGGSTQITLRATGSGRQLTPPGQACSADNGASQCSRAGDVCSFNNSAGTGGAICCSSACTNACQTCDATGTCAARTNGSSCGNGLACQGGNCLKQNGQGCVASGECSSNVCEPSRAICCSTKCGPGQRCAASGQGCESSQQGTGTACSVASQCVTGNCVDGVCCDGACGNLCEACNNPGSSGICSFRQADACPTAGQTCVARGQCNFPACVVGNTVVGQCTIGG